MTGFVLSGVQTPTVYVSGDDVSLDVVRKIGNRCGPIDVALLHVGAARTELPDAFLTLTSEQVAEVTDILDVRLVILLHRDGWGHITQGKNALTAAFRRRKLLDRLVLLTPGEPVWLPYPRESTGEESARTVRLQHDFVPLAGERSGSTAASDRAWFEPGLKSTSDAFNRGYVDKHQGDL